MAGYAYRKSRDGGRPHQIGRSITFRGKRLELRHFIPANKTSVGNNGGINSAQREGARIIVAQIKGEKWVFQKSLSG